MSALDGLRVAQVAPPFGGVGSYADGIRAIYEGLGASVQRHSTTYGQGNRQAARRQLDGGLGDADLVHIELGAGDVAAFWTAIESQSRQSAYLVTVHDAAVVHNAFPLSAATRAKLGMIGKVGDRLSMTVTSRVKTPRLAKTLSSHRAGLLPGDPAASFWLPHPLVVPAGSRRRPGVREGEVRRFGFVGTWSPSKGLQTLARAWMASHDGSRTLLITGAHDDRWARRVEPHLRGLAASDVRVGPPDDAGVDEALLELDALVLPYRSSWVGGASGVAQRAAELGVPIIASNLPALRAQLGADGAIWVPVDQPSALAHALMTANPGQLDAAAKAARATVDATAEQLPALVTRAAQAVLPMQSGHL